MGQVYDIEVTNLSIGAPYPCTSLLEPSHIVYNNVWVVQVVTSGNKTSACSAPTVVNVLVMDGAASTVVDQTEILERKYLT